MDTILNKFQRWYSNPENRAKHQQRALSRYYLNKETINANRKRPKLKTKGQKEFREKRAKVIHYLIRVRGKSYRQVADRLSFDDPKNVWKILNRYERKLNEKAKA